ncbi:MAG: VanW family protein [Armatimonadota bacterium]|nr:VanW family protein [Armatimonadota bacterium]MCX7777417.1 VanW family protein [Armatimonadota bacterium]MDW8025086.1 VanW family protein [Armatimonadota bacterium]
MDEMLKGKANRERKHLKRCVFWGAVVLFGVLVIFFLWAFSFAFKDDGRIIRGVRFVPAPPPKICFSSGIMLGGATPKEAELRLLQHKEQIERSKVCIVAKPVGGGSQWKLGNFEARSIGIRFDVNSAVRAAYEYGRRGGFMTRFKERWWAMRHGLAVYPKYVLNETLAGRIVEQLKRSIERPPKDAGIRFVGGRMQITSGCYGRRVGENQKAMSLFLWRALVEMGAFTNYELPIFFEPVRPQVSTDDLTHIDAVIGRCITYYSTRKVSRAHNIRLAAAALNGKLIRPGEVFSFNEAVGKRSFKRGYRVAPVLVRGEYRDDIGGGVCQVAGTLFNAALSAGLEIVERHRHSRPVGYLPAGMDATVDYGRLDLKLRNPYPYAVYIKAHSNSGRLTVLILGKQGKLRYEVRSELIKVIPPPVVVRLDSSLPVGAKRVEKRGRHGYVTATWRLVYRDGRVVQRELICRDTYPPQPRVIRAYAPANRLQSSEKTAPASRSGEKNTHASSHANQQSVHKEGSSNEQLIDVHKLFFRDRE